VCPIDPDPSIDGLNGNIIVGAGSMSSNKGLATTAKAINDGYQESTPKGKLHHHNYYIENDVLHPVHHAYPCTFAGQSQMLSTNNSACHHQTDETMHGYNQLNRCSTGVDPSTNRLSPSLVSPDTNSRRKSDEGDIVTNTLAPTTTRLPRTITPPFLDENMEASTSKAMNATNTNWQGSGGYKFVPGKYHDHVTYPVKFEQMKKRGGSGGVTVLFPQRLQCLLDCAEEYKYADIVVSSEILLMDGISAHYNMGPHQLNRIFFNFQFGSSLSFTH